MTDLVPKLKYTVPTLNHEKLAYYTDFPIVFNDTLTEEPFFVDYPFTIVTSDLTATTLYKWNGNSWTEVEGISNPEYIFGRGYFAVTTSSDEYVTITEHTNGALFEQ